MIAHFELIEEESDLPQPHNDLLTGEARDLGYMLHDIQFMQERGTKKVKSTTPHFFRATMTDGVISVPPLPFPLAS